MLFPEGSLIPHMVIFQSFWNWQSIWTRICFCFASVGFNGYICDCSSILDHLKKIWSHGISWGSRAPNWNQLNHLNMMFLFLELSFLEFHVLPATNIPAAHLIHGPDSKVMDVDRWQPPTMKWSQGGMDDENTWKVNESPFCPVPGVNPQLYQLYITLQTCTNR